MQIIGALVTAAGLLYAWNRASGRYEQWRGQLVDKLAEVRRQIVDRRNRGIELNTTITVEQQLDIDVLRPGSRDERLFRLEQEVSALIAGDQMRNVVDEKLADFDAEGKAFAVRDIWWALGGIMIGVVGLVLQLMG